MAQQPALRVVRGVDELSPPNNIEAEQSLIGALLVNNKAYYNVFETVDAEDFYDPIHGRIYDAIAKTIDSGRAADPKTLRHLFADEAGLKAVGGGANYLIDLAANCVTVFNIHDYARLIHELATRRRLLAFSDEVKHIAHDYTAPASSGEALVSAAETKLYELAERRATEGAVSAEDAFQSTINQIELAYKNGRPMGLQTGIVALDKLTGGLHPGKLYTLGARPAMGKTAFGVTIAANAAQRGAKVLLNTLEMEREEIVARLIARITHIPANKQQDNISPEEIARIFETRKEISSWPLYIDDSPGLKISQIRGRALRQKRRYGLDLLVIDYLGLIKRNDKIQNTNYQIEEITNALKTLAKELRIPVILLAQLNRELEKREDKRPNMADLRDSGSIEQDSDVVMFLYRHEYYLIKSEPRQEAKETAERFDERYSRWQAEVEKSRGRAELIIAKQRQGETGVVPLCFQGWRCMFTDVGGDNEQSV